jgi:hypothetical protein
MCKKKAEEILFRLKKINEGIHFINRDVIQLIANKKLLAFAYKTIKNKKSFIINSKDNDWFFLNRHKLWRYIYQDEGRFFFQTANNRSFVKSKLEVSLIFTPLAKKTLLKTLQLVLEAIFKESLFESGFSFNRPKAALQKIKISFQNAFWVIQTRIKSCFDSVKHSLLFPILHNRIKCKNTISLIRALINKRNEIKKGSFFAGIPKNILGNLLCNLFLNNLDYFVRRVKFFYVTSKKHRKINPFYYTLKACLQTTTTTTKRRSINKKLHNFFCEVMADSDFRRLFYVRYGDSFVIAVCGRYKESISILKKIDTFIQKNLFLELEQARTFLVPFRKSEFTFVGTRVVNNSFSEYLNNKSNNKRTVKTIQDFFGLQLYAPIEKILGKFKTCLSIKKNTAASKQHLWSA